MRKIFYISIHFCRIYYNIADENGRRDAAVDVAVLFVGLLLIGGESCITGGIGGFDDGIEVKRDGLVGLVAEVWQVEGDTGNLPFGAGHKLTDLYLKLDGIDEYHIVGIGVSDVKAGVKLEFHMQVVNATIGKTYWGYRTSGKYQTRIVDMYHTVFVGEVLLIDAGKLVVLNMPMGMGLLGKTPLDDGTKDGGGMLHGLEECTLPQLRLRLVVVKRPGLAAAELLAKASIEDTVTNGARLLNEGWYYLCHSICIALQVLDYNLI